MEAGWGAARKEGSVFQRKFRRWVKKLGAKKTNIAIGRSVLRVAWSVLKNDRPYVEPDNTVMKNLEKQKQVHHHAHRLRQYAGEYRGAWAADLRDRADRNILRH